MTRPVVLEGGGLRITLRRHGDRWSHTVDSLDGGDSMRLLESIEGVPNEHWPPSPPLQNLHVEERATGSSVALLVGMAGQCHWSLSIEIDPQAQRAVFDAACRLRGPAGFVGSSYRLPPYQPPGCEATTLPILLSNSNWELRRDLASAAEHLAEAQIEVKERRLIVGVARTADDRSRTVRWRYLVARSNRG